MPLQAVEAPLDVLTTNVWTMDVDGIVRPTFTNISGITRSVGNVQRADGGTGIVFKFSNQRVDFGQVTLTRQVDPLDPVDADIQTFLDRVIATGEKLNGELQKLHFGDVFRRYRFTGMLFISEAVPALDKTNPGPFNTTYTATVDFWEEVPGSA